VSNFGIAEATEEREHAEDIASSAVSSLSAASSLVEAWQGGRAIAFIPFARPGSPDPGPSHWIWQSSGSKKGFSVSQSLPDIINAIALGRGVN